MRLNVQIPNSNLLNVVFDGNSLTMQHNQYLSVKAGDFLTTQGFDVLISSFGIGGQRLLQMFNNAPTKIFPLVKTDRVNILVVNEDANGILQDGYTAEYNLQLMNQYIASAKANGYDYVMTWNGWNLRTPYDIFIPTESAVNHQIAYFDLANTSALASDLNIDMRNALHVGGGVGLSKNPMTDLDYIHRTLFSYDFGIIPYFCENIIEILN
jgi:hypothetical protein